MLTFVVLCERVTTTTLQKIWCFCGDSLTDVQWLLLHFAGRLLNLWFPRSINDFIGYEDWKSRFMVSSKDLINHRYTLSVSFWQPTSKAQYVHSCYCIWYKQVWPLHRCSVVTNCKILIVRWPGKLPLWLCYAINKIYITFVSSALSATRVTTQWFLQYVYPPATIHQILSVL